MRCILPPGHPLARRRVLRPQDLRDAAFVSYPQSFDARMQIDRTFAEHGVARRLPIEAQLSPTIVALIAQGAGPALIDPVTAAFAQQRVAVRRFEPAIIDQTWLACAVNQPVSRLAAAFAERARQVLDPSL